MEKQEKLVDEILRVLKDACILDRVLLIGSWCADFYRNYFKGIEYHPVIKTRDIDFLVSRKSTFPKSVDIEALLIPFGFDVAFFGNGYMKLESDELSLEFLVPEIGRGSEKPYPLPALKLNAQPLRHLDMLWRHPITVMVGKSTVYLPHPADYCLHKLIIAGKRKRKIKGDKDRKSASEVLEALIAGAHIAELRKAMKALPRNEAVLVSKELATLGYDAFFKK